jgi:hypothetical protein
VFVRYLSFSRYAVLAVLDQRYHEVSLGLLDLWELDWQDLRAVQCLIR